MAGETDTPLGVDSKIFSLEMVGSVIITTVLISGTWWGLSAKVQATETTMLATKDTVATLSVTVEEQQQAIAEINTNIAVISERLKAAAARESYRDRQRREAQHDMKEMLQGIVRTLNKKEF